MELSIVIVASIVLLILVIINEAQRRKNNKLIQQQKEQDLKQKELTSKVKSLQTLYGQAVEKVVPFMSELQEYFPDIKYLGEPIDYVAFSRERDMITFIEVKSGKARLTKKQERIKKLVEAGKIEFKEIRIEREPQN